MSVDEQCQVKCCERHLMCFISVCLNCPGTLESLSVNQIRRNETRLLSSEDTCLSAVTQANRGKRAFQAFWSTQAIYDSTLCIRNCSCGNYFIMSLQEKGKRSHTGAHSNIWSSATQIIKWGSNLDRDTLTVFHEAIGGIQFPKAETHYMSWHFFLLFIWEACAVLSSRLVLAMNTPWHCLHVGFLCFFFCQDTARRDRRRSAEKFFFLLLF